MVTVLRVHNLGMCVCLDMFASYVNVIIYIAFLVWFFPSNCYFSFPYIWGCNSERLDYLLGYLPWMTSLQAIKLLHIVYGNANVDGIINSNALTLCSLDTIVP